MSSCRYLLKTAGETFTFNSDQLMANFLINNANRLLVESGQVRFSREFSKRDEVHAKLLNLNNEITSAELSVDQYGNKIEKFKDYISVTRAITDPNFNGTGRPWCTGANMDQYFEHVRTQLKNQVKPDGTPYTDAEIEEEIKKMDQQFKDLAKLGTAVHKIMEIAFRNPQFTGAEIVAEFKKTKAYKDAKYPDEAINDSITFVSKLKSDFLSIYGPDAIYLPEFKLRTPADADRKVVGIIDLVVIDKDGQVHIFDFKSSPKSFNDYSQVKTQTFMYQLGIYAQMLLMHGIDTSMSSLNIIPILFKLDDNRNLLGLDPTVKVEPLDLRNTSKYYILQNISSIFRANQVAYMANTDNYDTVTKYTNELFGYDLEKNGYSKAIPKIWQNRDGKWCWKNPIDGSITSDTDKAKIEEVRNKFITENANNKIFYAREVANQFNYAKNNDQTSFDISGNKSKMYDFHFKKYLQEGWELNDSLLPLGVMMFTHPVFKTVELVYITNEDISEEVSSLAYAHNGKRITGNLIPDRLADTYTLLANVGNIELMRLMVIANEVLPELGDYTINDLKVISQNHKQSAYQNMDMLIHNFNQLVIHGNSKKNLGIVNNFISQNGQPAKIRHTKSYQKVMNQLLYITGGETIPGNLLYLKNYKDKLNDLKNLTGEQRISKLVELQQDITKRLIGDANFDNSTLVDALKDMKNKEDAMLYYMVYDAIREAAGHLYEYSYKDINRWISWEHLSPQQQSTVLVIGELQKKTLTKARSSIIKELNEEFIPIKRYCEDYLKKIHAFDSAFNSFDNLINMDNEAKILRVKNPYQGGDILQDHEKEFLTNWLKTINAMRFPTTNGDHTHPDAAHLVSSGVWFDIPLMRGGKINRGVFTYQSIKNNVSDIFDRASNPLEYIGQESKTHSNVQANRFDYYINPLAMSDHDRASLLSQKDVTYFNRDLANIALEYTYHDVSANIYDLALPTIRAGIICANAVNIMTLSELENTMRIFMEKEQTAIYKKQHLSENEKKWMGYYQVFSTMANVFTLINSPASFVRELFTGKYNNYGRALAKFGGKNAPTAGDMTKAYAWVLAEGVDATFHENVMNGFNQRWNISGRAMHEMKETHRALTGVISGQIFKSGSMYWANNLTEYYHRMALFVSYLEHEGILECYSWDSDAQRLVYDFKKDKRFQCVERYLREGTADSKDMQNIARYKMMLDEFNEDLPEDQKLKFGDALPQGITDKQVESIKNVSNQIHGNMDTDNWHHLNNYSWSKIMFKFMNHVPSKMLHAFLTPGKYLRFDEEYAVDPETGKPLYTKLVRNPQTGEGEVVLTTDPNEEGCTGQRAIALLETWEAGYYAGLKDIFYAAIDPEHRKQYMEELKNDPAKLAALKFAGADLLRMLLYAILGVLGLMPKDTLKDQNKFIQKMGLAAVQGTLDNDVLLNVSSVVSLINPMTFNINKKMALISFRALTGQGNTTALNVLEQTGMGKFAYLFHDE